MSNQIPNKKSKLLFISILFLALFGGADCSRAAITFANGFWSTSFVGCNTGNVSYGYDCDGLSISDEGSDTCGVYHTNVSALANNPAGGGGNGLRNYFESDTHNGMSNGARVWLPLGTTSFWLRFYYRLPAGQYMTGSSYDNTGGAHKIIYAFTDSMVAANVNWPSGTTDYGGTRGIELNPRNTMGSPDIIYGENPAYNSHNTHGTPDAGNWDEIYGSNTAVADGSWHYFEFHFALGATGSNNGTFRMWVDGANVANDTDLDWFSGGTASPTTWSNIVIPSNHDRFMLSGGGCHPHDIDDIALAISSYSGFIQDSMGRNMIGGISSPDVVPPAAPQGLAVS